MASPSSTATATTQAPAARAEPPAALPAEPLDYERASRRPRLDWRAVLARFGPFVGLVFVFGLFAALRPGTFPTVGNVEIMLLQSAVVATAGLGMTLIIISGGIDLSVGSAIALITVAVALMLGKTESLLGTAGLTGTLGVAAAALGGVLTGALAGFVIGGLITGLRLAPFIVTLGAWGAYRGVAKGFADQTMVIAPSTWLNDLLRTLGPGQKWLLFPPGVWIAVVLAVAVALALRYTRFGRHVFAIGSNESTARLCGVRVGPTKLLIYVVAGALVGVAGVLQFSYLTVGDPTTANGLELDIIAAVVIGGASLSGGQGSVLGTIIGALIMTVVANGCTKLGLDNWVQQIVTGCIIVAAVVLDRLRHRQPA